MLIPQENAQTFWANSSYHQLINKLMDSQTKGMVCMCVQHNHVGTSKYRLICSSFHSPYIVQRAFSVEHRVKQSVNSS